jgi:nitrogen fixation-related uncharacterized protein
MIQTLPESRGKKIFLIVFALAILAPAAYGFVEKLMLFILAVKRDLIAGFTIVPVVNYLIVTAGMACLLIWAIVNGMFRDVEGPKYQMLEQEERLEQQERDARKDAP